MNDSEYHGRRLTLIEYLHVKAAQADWHGVADAACDLRDLEAEERGRASVALGKYAPIDQRIECEERQVKVIEFNRVDLSSIEAGVEHTLNQIKQGAFPYAQCCIMVFGKQDGTTHVRAYGSRSDSLAVDGWMARALFGYKDEEAPPQSGSVA